MTDRPGHAGKLRLQVDQMRNDAVLQLQQRQESGLPEIKGKEFLIRVPDNADVDQLAHTLGLELIAETDRGFMFAGTESLDLERLYEVLDKFAKSERGGGGAAQVLEIYGRGDDPNRLDQKLVGPVRDLWPFRDEVIYTLDVGVQINTGSRVCEWSRAPQKRKGQTDAQYADALNALRLADQLRADEQWTEVADRRCQEVEDFIRFYDGKSLSGYSNEAHQVQEHGVVLADSIQVRIRMRGQGFRDLAENFKGVFEVSLPPDIRYLPGSPEAEGRDGELKIQPPPPDAPRVCIIDSGMQEEHRWIEPAVDKAQSRCFLPEHAVDDVGDFVSPRGHGTRVAGAVLYPEGSPKEGAIEPVAWLQNARVLDEHNKVPEALPPELYLQQVIGHYAKTGNPDGAKIFNHSISDDSSPCEGRRMTAWAAKIDDLVHRHDLLFIQISGNIARDQVYDALGAEREHPSHLLDEESKIGNPAQSLHALTVGSVCRYKVQDGARQSFGRQSGDVSPFSRTGHSPLWQVVKPEVVEFGGDWLHETPLTKAITSNSLTAPELVASTRDGEPAVSSNDIGTSFAAPKVAHIAAHLQKLFPDASAQLYRALIVHSARWPEWASQAQTNDVLRWIGYGIPSLERATRNNERRVTLVTAYPVEIWSKQYHLYEIELPGEIRGPAMESRVRMDITPAYTACPRRTRSRRTTYLETWLDWRAICPEEPLDHFKRRMERNWTGASKRHYPEFPWHIHHSTPHGETDEMSRDRGTVQKDWAILPAYELPKRLAIAVRAHKGWNHKEGRGLARYCLAMSFEAIEGEIPIYNAIATQVRAESSVETVVPVRT